MSCVRKYILYFTSSIVSSWHVSSLTKLLIYKAASPAWRNNIPHCSSLLSPSLDPWLTWTFPEIAILGPNSNAPLSLKWQPVVKVYNPAVISTKIMNQITIIHCPGRSYFMGPQYVWCPRAVGDVTRGSGRYRADIQGKAFLSYL